MGWEGIPNARIHFPGKKCLCPNPVSGRSGAASSGSLAAFIFAVVAEVGLESCSEPFWELKADPAPQQLELTAVLELTAAHWRLCPALDTCLSALEGVQQCWQSPELSLTCTLLPSGEHKAPWGHPGPVTAHGVCPKLLRSLSDPFSPMEMFCAVL